MCHNILITGGSGYLGGTILAQLPSISLPAYSTLYALVRRKSQAGLVQQYGAEPLIIDLDDHEKLRQEVISREISIIFFLIDALNSTHQPVIIDALKEVKAKTGREVHFLHTSGAKLFSSLVGFPTDRPVYDDEEDLYQLQKTCKAPIKLFQTALNTNNTVIELAEAAGVKSYIFAPCIVYGKGEGFGNKISIQTVAIIEAARKLRRVYKVDSDSPVWPVSHISDTTTLYLRILHEILDGTDIGHGRSGYFLAACGTVTWESLYTSIAAAMSAEGLLDTTDVAFADESVMQKLGDVLECPPDVAYGSLGGHCTLMARHGKAIGWEPKFGTEHAVQSMGEEVKWVLQNATGCSQKIK